MPVKLGAKLLAESAEARIEIVPLIDIMFFLLASFMLVSLSMVNIKSVKVNLPTATTATPEAKRDFLDVSVDKSGGAFLDKKPMAPTNSATPSPPPTTPTPTSASSSPQTRTPATAPSWPPSTLSAPQASIKSASKLAPLQPRTTIREPIGGLVVVRNIAIQDFLSNFMYADS